MMSTKPVTAPADYVPLMATGYGDEGSAVTAVSKASPLPVFDRPATRSVDIQPSDSATFPATGSVLIISGGTVVLRLADDDHDTVWPDLPAMTELRLAAVAVRATGTSATSIRGLY